MPAIPEVLVRRAGVAFEQLESVVSIAEREVADVVSTLVKRINIPYNSTSPPGLIEANTRDPWSKSGKYALGMVYFCIILLVFASLMRYYHLFTDKIRTVLHQEEVLKSSTTTSPDTDYELSVLYTDKSTNKFFPRHGELPAPPKTQSSVSSIGPINNCIAAFRFVFYHPIPQITIKKGWTPIVFPSLGVTMIVIAAFIFVTLYCFVPQPLYWQSIAFGSPPLAIRAGMLAVSLMPWIIGLSMKANIISLMTGIGHERLNVLHRWGGYLCLFLSLIHTVPFYITPIWDRGGLQVFKSFFAQSGFYVYGTGKEHRRILIPKMLISLRSCCSGAPDLPLRPFSPTTPQLDVRALCNPACAGGNCIPRYAFLALPQLPHLLELSLCNACNLGNFVHRALVFLELDKSVPDVLVNRR